ncbi:carbon monoxide dehydrogenase [Kiloniella spongiae]|uniref:Carbon monoxide dehydrogenase n=1 Tax=Kiloniella spongiae TaxID=1489064 RepID=A0A0H2MJ33_9PROT|nr:carbon monoxide dehydrogenase subunit G [Kiloniella spongiae]KLN62549.1 carbon monoxide dehydrogenase [Kiloniella spongiae]
MKMEGQQLIPAPQQKVWEALNNPEILKHSIPGCETVEKTSDTEFQASMTAKFGPVKAKFKGQVTLSDMNPPNSYTLIGEGKGGAAGFGKGEAKVSLEEQDGQTLLNYSVNAKVGGKLAQIGSRLVDSAAKKMADDFFQAFSQNVSSNGNETTPNVSSENLVETSNNTETTKSTSSNTTLYLTLAGVIIAAVVIYTLS